MSPRRTRRGTVLESSVIDASIDTSIKSANKSVRSARRTRRNQNVKNSEEENDSNAVVNNLTNNDTASFVNDSTVHVNKRRRKVQDSVLSQDISLSVTLDESKTKKSNLKTPKAKRQTRNNKSTKTEKTENNSLISEDESFNAKSQKDTKRVSYSMDNLISEDEGQPTPSKKAKTSNPKSKTSDKPSTSKKATTEKSTDGNVTPKSSPINVSFTPHRSTKTPKRSPINLGSPKTLPRSSLKLLNVPRRLSITASPPSSEKSVNLVKSQESTSVTNKSVENISITDETSKSFKGKPNSPKLKVKSRFSKSPKIGSKTPKTKSKKSPIKSQNVTPKKSDKSPTKPVESPDKLKKSPIKPVKSPAKTLKSTEKSIKSPEKLPKESEKSPTKTVESLNKLTTDSSLVLEKISVNVSITPSKARLTKSESPKKSVKNSANDSPAKLQKSSEKLSKSLKVNSSVESRKSFLNTSLKSKKSGLSTSFKSKKTPLLNLSSKKMPKIVLNLKSKKSPFKLSKTLSPKAKSPTKTPKTKISVKPNKSPKTVSPKKKSSADFIVNKSVSQDSSLSPRVILSKLSPRNSTPGIKNSTLKTPGKQPSVKLIPVDYKDQKSTKSSKTPRSPKSLAKRFSIKSSTPVHSSRTSISAIKNVNDEVKTPSHLLERKLLNIKPASTSTPRDRNIKRTLSVASNKKPASPKQDNNSVVLNGLINSKAKVTKRLNNSSNQVDTQLLEDESEPSLNESSLIHMSDVFDSDNSKNNSTFSIDKSDLSKRNSVNSPNTGQKGNKNKSKLDTDDTYELEHPKTPAIQKRAMKKPLDETGLSVTEDPESKKTGKVTFADPYSESQAGPSGISRMSTPGHTNQQKKAGVSVSKTKTPANRLDAKKRLSTVMKSQSKSTVNTPMSRRQSQIDSVNRLSRPKGITNSGVKVVKTPIAKKLPNFAEIHQKNFAKMESLVDLKKRVEKRHEVLNAAPSSTKKQNPIGGSKPLPPDTLNGAYSRFGFKLRKNDAVDIITKKQTGGVESREKKRENARTALKGVRMNRRFELQMKSRMKST